MNKSEQIHTHLPSLIHRIGGDSVREAKLLIAARGGELKRIRRSRNWQLISELTQLPIIINQLKSEHPDKMRYLIDKLEIKWSECGPPPETPQSKIRRLIAENPSITLAELMSETGCSISEARKIRFSIECL